MKPASQAWLRESNQVFDEEVAFQERYIDPESGAAILRLTCQPLISQNIYPEAHVSTPDGRRFIFSRRLPLARSQTYWIADLETLSIRQITDEEDASVPTVSPDGDWFYYLAGRTLRRISAQTYEREDCFTLPETPALRGAFYTTDPAGERFITAAVGQDGIPGAAVINRLDRTVKMIYQNPEALNAHPQFSRHAWSMVCIQVNNGIVMDAHGNLVKLVGEKGASLVVMDPDGNGVQQLNVGYSLLERVQGHQCWVGRENRVITTLHRRQSVDSAWVQDRIVTIAPGEETYQVVGEGQHFTHIHTDPDGRYWVSDSNRSGDIFIGSLQTARYRRLCRSGASFGAAQETHPHPFFLGDGRSIGWNSDESGIPQVYCARIPESFLQGLE